MPKTRTSHLFGIGKPWKTEALRLLRGPYTVAEVAAILHVGGPNIVSWENGTNRPTMPNLRALLKHYLAWTNDLAGAPMEWLIAAGAPLKGGKKWQGSRSTPARTRSSQPTKSAPSTSRPKKTA